MSNNRTNTMILAVFVVGAFFMILNETLLNIALTELMHQFHVSRTTVQWMASGFMMIMGIISPLSALIIQWFTTRKLFFTLIITFIIGSLIAGFALSFPMLLIGRMVQAIGTGLMIPLIMNTMLLLFDEKKRGKIMGTIGLVIMFAPAIGPTLSGVIVDLLGWRWLFFIVIPFMLFTLIFAYKYLSNVGEVTKPRIDILSIVLSTIGVTGIIYGFSESSSAEGGFLNPLTALPIIIGFLSIIVFVLRQRKLKEPILDFSVLKYANYRRGILIFLIVMMSMFASEIVMPMYLQGPMGFSAKVAGFILLPGAILNGLLSPAMGALFDKIGPRKLILPGLFALFGVALFYTKIHPGLSMITFIIAYIVLMVAISAIMMPASTNGLNALPKEKYPHGTAIFNLLQPIGGALGVAIFVGILTALQNHKLQELGSKTKEAANEAMTFGLHGSFFFAAILIAIAIVIASTLTTASNEKSKIKASRKG